MPRDRGLSLGLRSRRGLSPLPRLRIPVTCSISLSRLVSKSLLNVESCSLGDRRYRFLETIRHCARERLTSTWASPAWPAIGAKGSRTSGRSIGVLRKVGTIIRGGWGSCGRRRTRHDSRPHFQIAIRSGAAKTGERDTAARRHVLRALPAAVEPPPQPTLAGAAARARVNAPSLRVPRRAACSPRAVAHGGSGRRDPPRWLTSQRASAAVADHAAGRDVERHVANRQARLIAQASGKLEEALRVGEVARDAERHADRAGALAAAVRDELQEARQRHVASWSRAPPRCRRR